MKYMKFVLMLVVLTIAGLAYYLMRPLTNVPSPATFTCLDIEAGSFMHRDSLPAPSAIYGMGLTYGPHLIETSASFDPDAPPPIFKKDVSSLTGDGATIKLPSHEEMLQAVATLEPGVAEKTAEKFEKLSPLLDYEVELGIVLLEDISAADLQDAAFIPQLGFFVANDLSARSLALLGEGSPLRYDYWGISKSFAGFTPVSERVWVPHAPTHNSIPCLTLETFVNGEQRQSQSTDQMIYTPLEMLHFIHQKYPDATLKRGDMILTGTPGGVAIATPRALVRLGNLLGFDRYRKLEIKLGDEEKFLQAGDRVEAKVERIGSVGAVIE